jgi:hypothetical protein
MNLPWVSRRDYETALRYEAFAKDQVEILQRRLDRQYEAHQKTLDLIATMKREGFNPMPVGPTVEGEGPPAAGNIRMAIRCEPSRG